MVVGTMYLNASGLVQTRFPPGYEVLQDLIDGELGFSPATGKHFAEACRDIMSGTSPPRDIRCNIVLLRIEATSVVLVNHLASEVTPVRFATQDFLSFLNDWRQVTKGKTQFDSQLAGKSVEAKCEPELGDCRTDIMENWKDEPPVAHRRSFECE